MVARLIQRKFSKDGFKVYGIKEIKIFNEKDESKNRIKYQIENFSIENTMSRDYCYEFPKYMLEKGFNENYLENFFAEKENEYVKLLEILINKIEDRKSFMSLKDFVFKNMMPYFLWFYYRTYQYALLGISTKDIEEQRKETLLRFKDTLFNSDYLNKLSITIKNCYNLYILESPSENFLLSDSFLCTASIDFKGFGHTSPHYLNRSIGLKNIVILIPISAKYYILFTDSSDYKGHYIKVYDKDILKYNSIIFRNSFEFTIGKNKEILDDTINNSKKYFYGIDCAGGNFNKPEIWVDEDIDRNYYLDGKSLVSKEVGYCLYKKRMNGDIHQIEKGLENINEGFDFKIINLNPNYKHLLIKKEIEKD